MRNGFTLMEVLVAVMIASLVGMALLQMNAQSIHLFDRLRQTTKMTEVTAVAAIHADKRFHKTDKTLYDLLDDSYDITSDEFRKFLKDHKYSYQETVLETVTFGEVEEAAAMTEEEAIAQEEAMIQFELIQVTIKDKLAHAALLIARPF